MNAKEYLGQAYRLDQRINSKLQQIESLRSLTQKVTASCDGEPVSHTRNVSSLEDTIIRLMNFAALIDKVRNESYRLILEKRYLCFLPWDQIAAYLHYCRRWTLNRHDRAVEVVEKLMCEEGLA